MLNKSVIGVATTEAQAHSIVSMLRSRGFVDSDISLLRSTSGMAPHFGHEASNKSPEGAAVGALSGGAVGGTIGVLAGIGMLAIPVFGPFVAAGPILAALSGIAIGGSVGGVAGGLIGFGVPEIEAKAYDGRVNRGEILIAVHAETADALSLAKDILTDEGAHDVATVGEQQAKAVTKHDSSLRV